MISVGNILAAEITDKLGLHSLRQRYWCHTHGLKNFTPSAASILGAMAKVDNNYYPESRSVEAEKSYWLNREADLERNISQIKRKKLMLREKFFKQNGALLMEAPNRHFDNGALLMEASKFVEIFCSRKGNDNVFMVNIDMEFGSIMPKKPQIGIL
ncbi:hypothetical protein L1987_01366 [Smallanthus sonchifolius]|uniref:Uncharacterized protein n=1 Tax=Smallanthus sonchifolius TaxID=185202 RepID=A0ACB9K4W6_9ASTR|nr:hypothetical protein L1987_01366 [Smallanthus sonchifolius]